MAFYWREMIQWYKTRGTGARDVNDLQVAGVKRQASTSGLNLEEGVELIDRLVKKCR